MNSTWKIFLLAFISLLVGTAQFVIVGILDKIAASTGVSVSTAGQITTILALANAIGTPIVITYHVLHMPIQSSHIGCFEARIFRNAGTTQICKVMINCYGFEPFRHLS